MRLACTCSKNFEFVWPPNASLYASRTCVHLRLLAGPFGPGFTDYPFRVRFSRGFSSFHNKDRCSVACHIYRDLTQNTTATATATRTPQNKGLISRTIAVHVRYNSWYISLPSSAKQQREMTKLCVDWRT